MGPSLEDEEDLSLSILGVDTCPPHEGDQGVGVVLYPGAGHSLWGRKDRLRALLRRWIPQKLQA